MTYFFSSSISCDHKIFYKHKLLIKIKFLSFFKNSIIIMQLTIEQRWEIIFLYLHRLGPKLNIRKIAKELKYSKTIVKKRLLDIKIQKIL